MKGIVISMFVVLAMVQFMSRPTQAVTCGQVDACLIPCISFLTTGIGAPSEACCGGVKNLKGLATTIADKRTACNCVKEAAAKYQNIKDDAATALPTKCGVQMDIPISRSTNCDIIH